MNPTTPILAIDLGKFNSVFYRFQTTTGEGVFRSVKTNSDSLRRELTRQPIDCVVVEACSPAGWVHDLCGELSLACHVANTAGVAWAWKNVPRKTDPPRSLGRRPRGHSGIRRRALRATVSVTKAGVGT
ncbi:MAG: hypothetical protein RMJ52_11115 [Gemmataceae bacterium]|nr:hypothetical protein [Gemmataceae bacterium]